MSKPSEYDETYTALDHLFKVWLDQYPPEKTTALQDRVLSLGKTLRELNAKFTRLQTAKCRLSNLYKPLPDALNCLNEARFSHADFIKNYGNLGVSIPTPTATMESTIAQYMGELKDYADLFAVKSAKVIKSTRFPPPPPHTPLMFGWAKKFCVHFRLPEDKYDRSMRISADNASEAILAVKTAYPQAGI